MQKQLQQNLSETVKVAVFKTIKNQRTEEHGKVTVAIYSLLEKSNDYDRVRKLFQALN